MAADAAGNVYVSDGENSAIRRLTPSGASYVTTTIIGTANHAVAANDWLGTPAPALLAFPSGVAVRGGVIHVSVQDAILKAVVP